MRRGTRRATAHPRRAGVTSVLAWRGALLVVTLACVTACADAQRPATPPARPSSTPAPTAASSPATSPASPGASGAAAQGYGAREVARRRCTDEQRSFWRGFREAALGASVDSVVARTRFPFTVRGELDDSPVRRLDRVRFRREWPALLAADPRALGTALGDDTTATSMREVLQRHAEPRDAWCIAAGQMNVGTFAFLADARGRLRLEQVSAVEP